MDEQNNRTQKIEEFLLDPEKVLFESIEEFSGAVAQILSMLQGIDLAEIEAIQGEDGYTPQRGIDYMTQEDIDALEAFIIAKMPRDGIDFPTREQVEGFIKTELAKIPRIKGDKGEKGTPGKPGRDGSRDTGKDIIEKVRKLPKNQGWKIDDVRGLRGVLSSHTEALSEVEYLRELVEGIRTVIPNISDPGIQDINGLIEAGTNVTITGNGTSADPYIINSSGMVSVEWGDIGGTLSAQTDLQNALNDKLEDITGLITEGTNITITGTGTSGDPYVITAAGGSSGGQVDSVVAGTGIDVDATDPVNPVVNLDSATIASLDLADTAVQDLGDLGITASATELNYTTGVTSAIQTQLAAKQATITGGASTIVSSNLTASRALVSDSSGKVAVSDVTATELGYLDGVTSSIQTQLNGKQATISVSDTAEIDLTFSANTLSASIVSGSIDEAKLDASVNASLDLADSAVQAASTNTLTNKIVRTRNAVTTSASSLTPDFDTANYYEYTALAANFTLNAPSNMSVGDVLTLVVEPTGANRTFTNSSGAVFVEGNTAPTEFELGYKYQIIIDQTTGDLMASWTRIALA